MNELEEVQFLLQTDWRDDVIPQIGNEAWVTTYDYQEYPMGNSGFFCALIPFGKAKEVLSNHSWDLMKGHGMPGHSVGYNEGAENIVYHRFGDDHGLEPLILLREFHDVRPDFLEVAEEFRHFHNLYFDGDENVLIKIADDGSEEVVVRMFKRKVEMRLKELRQFLAIKEMFLAVYFHNERYSTIAKEIVEGLPKEIEVDENLTKYEFHINADPAYMSDGTTAFSRIIGKKLVQPFSKEKSGQWPYNEDDPVDFEDFIIGTDSDSNPILHTCDHNKLANYFGKNPDAPHYVTPVFFRREVLGKYFSDPDRYSIEDGYLRFVSLWGLRLDNNHPKHVIVYLGDLGRDIPNSEQKYWKSFNIPPEGEISEVQFKRGILGEFADPESPDLLLKLLIGELNRKWQKTLGWNLFEPFTKEDQHFFTSLRIPINTSQAEFDSQVLSLTKILIDSLNEKEIVKKLSSSIAEEKGISKFKRLLDRMTSADNATHISFLRDLQELRSKGSAHRKGDSYSKTGGKFGIGKNDLQSIFVEILLKGIELLKFIDSLDLEPKAEQKRNE